MDVEGFVADNLSRECRARGKNERLHLGGQFAGLS